MRNDGHLYSGINSQTFSRRDVREQAKRTKQENQAKLTPAAQLIVDRIDNERSRLGEVLASLIDSSQSAEQVQVHVEAVKLHRQWLQAFEAQFLADLRRGRIAAEESEDV